MILCDELLFKRKVASGGRKPTGGGCREAKLRETDGLRRSSEMNKAARD